MLVLGVDLGTTRMKAAVFDAAGDRLPHVFAEASPGLSHNADGAAEIDPLHWREAFLGVLRELLGKLPAASPPVKAVAVSSFWHGLLGLDDANRPLTPIFTWADSRCREQASELRRSLQEAEIHRRTGCMLRSSFWPAKLRWLRAIDAGRFAEVRRWVSPADWLEADFCGPTRGGVGLASGTGFLNSNELAWDRELLKSCALSADRMAPLDEAPRPVGGAASDAFTRLRGALWFPALGDGAAGNLGSGADSEGWAAVNLGTSAAVRVLRSAGPARAPLGLFCYRVDREAFLVGGASSNSGNLRQWCLRELRIEEDGEVGEDARRRPLHGLTVVPSWVAERAPSWDGRARGAIAGLGMSTTAGDIFQALREASDYRLAEILESLKEGGERPRRLIASGGGAGSRGRLQCLADALGEPVWPSAEREASLRGAVVWALRRLGLAPRPARLLEPLEPDPEIAAIHASLRRRQRAFEAAARELF